MTIDSKKIVDKLFSDLRGGGYIPEEDISWVSVSSNFLNDLDGELLECKFKNCCYKKYQGVEFRESRWAEVGCMDLKGWFVWNITKRTRDLFNWELLKPKKNKS